MAEFVVPGLVLLGVVIGAVLTWLLSRGRGEAQMAAAVSRAEAAAEGELAQLRERVRTGDETREQAQSNFDQLKREAAALQDEVEAASQEAATLRERASQVPTLVSERDEVASQLRASQDESRRLSNEVSDQGASLRLLKERVAELAHKNANLERRLEAETEAVSTANQRIATLDEQAARLPGLQRQVEAAAQQHEATNVQLNDLRETSGRDISRLNAEVEAERDAHALVRAELSREKVARAAADTENTRLTGGADRAESPVTS